MNRATLVRRGLGFYRRTHLGVVAGCAVSAAVLVGALFVGDSVKGSLERIALARLGKIHVALDSGNRFFRETLAARIRDGLRTDVAAALAVPGMAIRDASHVNRVQVLGIDAQFLALAEAPSAVKLGPGQVALNPKLANALGAKVGDDLRLRLIRPSLLSREAPLASQNEKDTRRNATVTVVAVLTDAQLGRFSLRSDQAGPYSAYVDRAWLQETLDLPGRANLIVAGATSFNAQEWLRSAWTFEDLGVVFRAPEGRGVVQLESERVYLEPAVAGPARQLRSDHAAVLYYLVDAISAGGKSTPYSFVTAITPTADAKLGPVPQGMKDDEILVNRWLADQLGVREGETVKVAYSVPTVGNAFVPKSRDFKVRGVIEMAALAGEKELVPEFPGLTDVDACKDWKIGIPTEDEKLNDKANEKYWDTYRQTPKAFITLAAGREMWANRHGDLMAIRYLSSATNQAEIKDKLRDPVDPAFMGLVFQPVREAALRAATESMDLGQLFLGMSIFLVAASLILTAMFFVFSVEQRAKEMGVLFAVGYTTPQVRRLFLSEGAVLAVLGSAAGVPLGWGFAKALVWGLGTAWSGVVADAAIEFHARAVTAGIGAAAAAAISLVAMAVALWRQARRPVRELVAEDFSVSLEREALAGGGGGIRKAVFLGGLVGAAAVVVGTLAARVANPAGAFFGAGGLMLVSAVAWIRMRLATLSTPSTTKLSVKQLGSRNAARRPGRSLATAGMLACGCFVVFSVSVMKEDLATQAGERKSGTGGFRLYAESSLAIPHDLNGERGRKEFRLNDREILEKVSIVPLRLREGDDASCLNLNQSLTPPLLGVDAAALGRLGAFAGPELWSLLDRPLPDGAVPALVGDSATAMWKLKKKVGEKDGDLLEYKDERGRSFQVKLVGALPSRLTVLQGRLLISQEAFTRLYPGEGGYRTFLVDVPDGREEPLMRYLSQRLETAGFDVVPSVERLKEFYVVESSYLRLFMVLGGLGLLLGSAGMGVLVLRHVMERRGELALLRAVGYTESQAASLVMAEHRFLVVLGLVAGVAASAVSIVPTMLQPRSSLPFGFLAVFLFGTAILSLAWIRIATAVALRAPLVPALRHE